jgi:hypothetical protein
MGSLNGSNVLATAWGVLFQNNTGQTITSVTVNYTGEQWRRAKVADSLQFSYRATAAPFTDLTVTQALPSGWVADSSLSFSAIHVDAVGARFQLNGNLAENRLLRSESLSVNIPSGQYLALRWYDTDSALNMGAALGIDDLTVSFGVAAVPESSALWLVGTIALITTSAALWRRRAFQRA